MAGASGAFFFMDFALFITYWVAYLLAAECFFFFGIMVDFLGLRTG